MKKFLLWSVVVLAGAASVPAQDQNNEVLIQEIKKLNRTVERLENKVDQQQKRIEELEKGKAVVPTTAQVQGVTTPEQSKLAEELAKELAGASPASTPKLSLARPITLASGQGSYVNISMDILAAAGTSTVRNLQTLQLGGHDPVQRGFTLQNAELVLDGAIDPYFRGQANVVLQLDSAGASTIELEEAYLTTTSLPWNLQVKAGQYFSEFGRLNPTHPHSWDFVDAPLVNSRLLGGDGLRNPGVQVSWLMPTPFYAEAFLSVQDSQGSTAASFRNVAGETQFGRTLQDRPVRSFGDMLIIPRLVTSFDLTDTQTVVLGTSGAFGPNASGQDTGTEVFGVDAFWKWKSANAHGGFPFLKWQTEGIARRYEAGADPLAGLPREALWDWGAYTQLVWGFHQGWTAGLRGDYVNGSAGAFSPDPDRNQRWRLSPMLTFYPSEFSKLRLQYNLDEVKNLGPEHSVWLQMEFLLGAHGAHKF